MAKIVCFLIICCLCIGCTGVTLEKGLDTVDTIDSKAESTLQTVEIASVIARKVVELHKSGVDQEVLDQINDAIKQVHAITDKHHKERVKK